MFSHELKPPPGAKRPRKRVGRGYASGTGTYSGKGLKGQKARAGAPVRGGFEGGQTPLVKKLPKRRGFKNRFRTHYSEVNLRSLSAFEAGTEVTPELLKKLRIVRNLKLPVKVLGDGDVSVALTVRAHKFTQAARAKIEGAGGKALEVDVEVGVGDSG